MKKMYAMAGQGTDDSMTRESNVDEVESAMRFSAALQQAREQTPTEGKRSRLLLVADSVEQMQALRITLAVTGAEFTCIHSLAELRHADWRGHALIVVNVAPAQLRQTLEAIRRTPGWDGTPILASVDRIRDEPGLAGVLPAYRAMACGPAEMLALARRRLGPTIERSLPRQML
ncbi:MAG: hypothetical protein ACKV2V_16715 [Blastocatellia bacterium]